jgi:hypothetical protein
MYSNGAAAWRGLRVAASSRRPAPDLRGRAGHHRRNGVPFQQSPPSPRSHGFSCSIGPSPP